MRGLEQQLKCLVQHSLGKLSTLLTLLGIIEDPLRFSWRKTPCDSLPVGHIDYIDGAGWRRSVDPVIEHWVGRSHGEYEHREYSEQEAELEGDRDHFVCLNGEKLEIRKRPMSCASTHMYIHETVAVHKRYSDRKQKHQYVKPSCTCS